KAVKRRHDREGLSVTVVGEFRQLQGKRRLAGARRAGDSEQEPFPVRRDGREQLVGQRYSLLDRAQRLTSLSVAYLSISASSSSVKPTPSGPPQLAST